MEYKCESAVSAVSNMAAGWNLGNTLDATGWRVRGNTPADFETAWGNPVTTREMLTAVKQAGFNALRLPVTWRGHFDEDYAIEKPWLDRVNEVVDYAVSQGMYCILNTHHDGGPNSWIAASEARFAQNGDGFARLWVQIADRFAEYDDKLLFEAVNEPLNEAGEWKSCRQIDYDGVMLYNQRFVDAVRSRGGYNKERNLAVMPYAGAHSDARLNGFAMPKDSAEGHLILEVHNYDPTGFTWHDPPDDPPRSTWGTQEDYTELTESMEALLRQGRRFGVPVIIGEYGVELEQNDAECAKYASCFSGEAARRGIKCFWWDCGDFALLDRRNVRMLHPEVVEAIIGSAAKYSNMKY